MYAKYAMSSTVRETTFERLMIMMKDPLNKEVADTFLKDMRKSISAYRDQNINVYNYANSLSTLG